MSFRLKMGMPYNTTTIFIATNKCMSENKILSQQ